MPMLGFRLLAGRLHSIKRTAAFLALAADFSEICVRISPSGDICQDLTSGACANAPNDEVRRSANKREYNWDFSTVKVVSGWLELSQAF